MQPLAADETTRKRSDAGNGFGFRGAVGVYLIALGVFVLWIMIDRSEFWILLGTLIFTVGSAFLAMFKFSRDIERSTREQMFTFREATAAQIAGAERHAREYVDALGELRELEGDRLEGERREKEERRQRLTPRVFLRVGEKAYFAWMKDFWILVRVTVPVEELKVTGRPVRVGTGRSGSWCQETLKQTSPDTDLLALKLGDVGVRGVYDGAEVRLDVLTKDFRKLRGVRTVLFHASSWEEMSLELSS